MKRWTCFIALAFAGLPACAIAFSPGLNPAPAPEREPEGAKQPNDAENLVKEATATAPPPVGVSLVVGGEPFDAGVLPKPPIPVVLLK
jgi:hypothetical protein